MTMSSPYGHTSRAEESRVLAPWRMRYSLGLWGLSGRQARIMKPDSSVASVVLVGAFAPSKFLLPALAAADVLSSADVASAAYEMLLRDQGLQVSLPWGTFLVTADRFTVEAKQAPYVRAADFVLKCMREIASASTVRQMGINLKTEYIFRDPTARDSIGKRLLPAAAWGPWGRVVEKSQELPASDLQHGGLACAVLRQQKPEGRGVEGYVDARVDAATPTDAGWGVFVSINDHYQASGRTVGGRKVSEAVVTAGLLDMLEESFDSSVAASFEIANGIIAGT